jgi:hypothetical protein
MVVPSLLPCLSCPVLPVLSHLSCPPCLSRVSCPPCLSRVSCPSCSAPLLLSTAHLSPESSPCCHVPASRTLCPVLPELSRLTCQANLSRKTCQANLSRKTCQANLSRLTCLDYPSSVIADVMSQMSCPNFTDGCPATVVPSQFYCPSCPVLLLCSGHPVLSFLSCLYHPDILRLSGLCCPA